MKRIWMLNLLIVGLFLPFLSVNAFAESTKVGEYLDESGDVFELFQEDDGSFLVWVHRKDGTFSYFNIGTESNPDPDDPHGVGGKPDIKELARRYYKGKLDKGVQTNNPFALKQSGQGKGLAPIWNPPDTVKAAGRVSAPATVPAQEISSGGSEGRQGAPQISPSAPKVLPSVGIQPVQRQ